MWCRVRTVSWQDQVHMWVCRLWWFVVAAVVVIIVVVNVVIVEPVDGGCPSQSNIYIDRQHIKELVPGIHPNQEVNAWNPSKSRGLPQLCIKIKELTPGNHIKDFALRINPNQGFGTWYSAKLRSWSMVCIYFKELVPACSTSQSSSRPLIWIHFKELASVLHPNQGDGTEHHLASERPSIN